MHRRIIVMFMNNLDMADCVCPDHKAVFVGSAKA